jgi:hypothetical protein
MSLKIWLALTLFLIVTVSGVVGGLNWGIDAQGNVVDYNNLNPTTPSYKAAKEAFLAEHPFLTEYDAFTAPGTLQNLAKAMQGDITAQAWLAATWGFKVGSYIEYYFIAEEVFGPTTAQELLQDAKDHNVELQGNFIKPDPITEALKKQGLETPLLSLQTSDISSDAGSSVSGVSGVSQAVTPQNDNFVMTKLRICNACQFPIGVPQNWDWMYNKNDGNYYTTYNGYYWVYDPQDRDPTMVNGVLMSSNPFPGSPPKYTTTSTAGVGPLV